MDKIHNIGENEQFWHVKKFAEQRIHVFADIHNDSFGFLNCGSSNTLK